MQNVSMFYKSNLNYYLRVDHKVKLTLKKDPFLGFFRFTYVYALHEDFSILPYVLGTGAH